MSWIRRVGWLHLLWLVIGLVLVVLMRKAELSYAEKLAPLPVMGALNQRIVARNFAATVSGFRLARSYKVAGASPVDPLVLRTPGVWMSVVVKLEALHEPGYVSARVQTRDGSIYQANKSDRPRARGVNLIDQAFAPDLPANGAYFFELPPAQVPGAHVQLYWGTLTPAAMDSLIDVDLGSGGSSVDEQIFKTAPEIDLRS